MVSKFIKPIALGVGIGLCASVAYSSYKGHKSQKIIDEVYQNIRKNNQAIPADTFQVLISKDTIYKGVPETIYVNKAGNLADTVAGKSKALFEQGLKNLKKVK